MSAAKDDLRRRMKAWRESLPAALLAGASAAIADRLFSLDSFKAAHTVLFYVSFGKEVDTRPMIQRALRSGKRVCAPQVVISENRLLPRAVAEPDRDLVRGFAGIPEPDPHRTPAIAFEEIDLVLVPGLAFDPRGYRLGYGRGFYDRFLAGLPPRTWRVGLCLEAQVVDVVPTLPWDLPVHRVVTETRVIVCPSSPPIG